MVDLCELQDGIPMMQEVLCHVGRVMGTLAAGGGRSPSSALCMGSMSESAFHKLRRQYILDTRVLKVKSRRSSIGTYY